MTQRKFWVWTEDTCWVCTGGGVNKPSIHASSKGPDLRSPCATTPVVIVAEDRKSAIKQYRSERR